MSKVVFLGSDSARDGITCMGIKFKTGVGREVPDRLLSKFKGHPEFEVDGQPYQLAESAIRRQGIEDVAAEDEIESGPKEPEDYTLEELTQVLKGKHVVIPPSIATDMKKLTNLINKHGGFPA